jgi:methionyl-tRNA formyltransferase
MRLVMMGTGRFAVPTFEALLSSPHKVVALVTRPQRRGRGGRPPLNPMREAAERVGIRLLDPPSINHESAVAAMQQMEADLMVVCDYGQILSSAALATTRLGGANLHASLLPAYRGAAPINWAIYDGRKETGISVIHMTPKLDAGPVLLQRRVPIGLAETAVEVETRLAQIGAGAILESIELLDAWDGTTTIGRVQVDQQATKAPRLRKEDGLVDWNRTATEIFNQVRAFQPWPGTYTFFSRGGKARRLILHEVTPLEAGTTEPEPGSIVESSSDDLIVTTGCGRLKLRCLQPEGKKRLSGAEFVRGYQIGVGSRLGE